MATIAAGLGRWAGRGAIVVAALAFLVLAVGPRTGSYRTLTVLSGSMRPTFPPGSVLLSEPVPVADLRVGDVITYSIPVQDHRIVTHRVVRIVSQGVVQTKGDANRAVDPWVARLAGTTAWRVRGAIPGLGYLINALSRPVLRVVTVFGSLGGALALGLRSIWRRPLGA